MQMKTRKDFQKDGLYINIFALGLPTDINESTIREQFGVHGNIVSIHFVKGNHAYIRFREHSEAKAAFESFKFGKDRKYGYFVKPDLK